MTDQIFELCSEIFEEFKDRVNDLASDLAKRVNKKVIERNIPIKVQYKNGLSFSKEKLLIDDRIINQIKDRLSFTYLAEVFLDVYKDIDKESENFENKDPNETKEEPLLK